MKKIVQINQGNRVLWKQQYLEPQDHFGVRNSTVGTITCTLTKNGGAPAVNLEYSNDGGYTWTVWNADANGNRSLSIPAGSEVKLRGVNPNGFCPANDNTNYYSLNCSGNYTINGDIGSLLTGSGTLMSSLPPGCFRRFFYNSSTLQRGDACYVSATNFGNGSCNAMFRNCTNMTYAPSYYSQGEYGYDQPSALSLDTSAFADAFNGCSHLGSVTMDIVSLSGTGQCKGMFSGCSNLIDASNVHLDASTALKDSYTNMFYNCTSLSYPPSIQATDYYGASDGGSFTGMFNGCSHLRYVRVLFTDWKNGYGTQNWLNGTASGLTKAPCSFACPDSLPATRGTGYIPNGWQKIPENQMPAQAVDTYLDGNTVSIVISNIGINDGIGGRTYYVRYVSTTSSGTLYTCTAITDPTTSSYSFKTSNKTTTRSGTAHGGVKVIATANGFSASNSSCSTW